MPNPATTLRTPGTTLHNPPAYLPTGNEWLALPDVRPDDGAVESINLLHMGARGLVAFEGAPLLLPEARDMDQPLVLSGSLRWERVGRWMPRWRWIGADLLLTGTLVTPAQQRGCVYLLSARNTGLTPRRVYLGLRGSWERMQLQVVRRRALPATRTLIYDDWTDTLVLEASTGLPLAALALTCDGPMQWRANEDLSSGRFSCAIGRTVELAPGAEVSVPIFIAGAVERDGAAATAMDLRRHGWQQLLEQAQAWLRAQIGPLLGGEPFDVPATGSFDPYLNLLFNRLYAYGRSIDSEQLVCLTSRSPHYDVSAAYWSRDTLLLSFPALLLHDAGFAREVLLTALRRYGHNAAEHAQAIDGTRLYPGFGLDQYCAPALALQRYVNSTGDLQILDTPEVRALIDGFVNGLSGWQDPRVALFRTFLRSTDEPAGDLPYVTFSNALVACALRGLAALQTRSAEPRRADLLRHMATLVSEAIDQHCVSQDGDERRFVGAVDLAGQQAWFDEPPGSLLLLPLFGFCSPQDPRYAATADWILSAANPQFYAGPAAGPGSATPDQPWPLALAHAALAGRQLPDAVSPLERLQQLPLDGGICCQSIHADSGTVASGRHFATAAGWLAYAWFTTRPAPSSPPPAADAKDEGEDEDAG